MKHDTPRMNRKPVFRDLFIITHVGFGFLFFLAAPMAGPIRCVKIIRNFPEMIWIEIQQKFHFAIFADPTFDFG